MSTVPTHKGTVDVGRFHVQESVDAFCAARDAARDRRLRLLLRDSEARASRR